MRKRTFAGIVEGANDKRVITNILAGYFNNPDIKPTWLREHVTFAKSEKKEGK
jgi:hypothetical protein